MEKNSINQAHVIWDQSPNGRGIRILKMFGQSPCVKVPAFLDGIPVTELGAYCFAPQTTVDKKDALATEIRELSGSYITRVELPETLTTIGSYAFYNCRKLEQLVLGGQANSIDSDAFMNCHALHQLLLTCSVDAPSGLRQILSQISWDVGICFYDQGLKNRPQAELFYPEYTETLDEIAPAHIFERKISGEGFRARQGFINEAPDLIQYDKLFQKAGREESVWTLCRMALPRLRYPIGLTEPMKRQYEDYVLEHGDVLCAKLIQQHRLEELEFLYFHKLLSEATAAQAVQNALDLDWAEGAAVLLRYKQQVYGAKKKRYEFEEF